mgnify:CR=1 FL=1
MDIFYPIQLFADTINNLVGLAKESYLGSAINFFVYDTIKIGLLLVVINYIMAITRYYFPMEKARDILTKKRWFGLNYLMAAVLGIVTPFCSCSSIPLFIGFMGAGFDTNTFVHYVEEEVNIGYRYIKTFKGKVIAGDTQRAVTFRYRVRPLQQGAVDYDWVRLERDLLHNGLMKVFSVGLGELKVVEGKGLYDYWLANLKRDEWFLLTEESKMILRELSKRHRYPFTFEEMEAATIKKEGG